MNLTTVRRLPVPGTFRTLFANLTTRPKLRGNHPRLLFLLSLLATACGGASPAPACDKAEGLRIDFEPYAQLNHDREGYPRSVVVRIYQLQDLQAFEQASFDDIWAGDDRGMLGTSLVGAPDALTLVPAQRESVDIKRHPKASHLALAANFREHQHASSWKIVTELPAPRDACAKNATVARLYVELANYAMVPSEWTRKRGAP